MDSKCFVLFSLMMLQCVGFNRINCGTYMNISIIIFTLWLFNMAMENGPFIDGLPIKNDGSFHGHVSHSQRVIIVRNEHMNHLHGISEVAEWDSNGES